MTKQHGVYGEFIEVNVDGITTFVPKFATEMRKGRIFSVVYAKE
ncbi:MAG: hypothetical protein PHU12_02710 [Candidatus Aenigmarchaeota archaeon]|nr:hypothetical protein [Candidatus Aenigmarchaeota archaeon]